jgi:hypothetical protein
MLKRSTISQPIPALLANLFALIQAHRPAFRQERPFLRAWALVLAELFTFARHTVTQELCTLGLTQADWSAWYRLFSRPRFDEDRLAGCLLRETLQAVLPEQPYVVGIDTTQIPRTSRKLPGSGWLKAPRTPIFKIGIHRAQRFLHGAWLTPLVDGFSRAVPLRFLPAFPAKAVPAGVPPQKEWQAGLAFLAWVRGQLDQAGRAEQPVLALADGSFDRLGFWEGLPERVVAVVRTAKNRVLYALPTARAGRGRPAQYGPRAPTPQEWLHQGIHFDRREVVVRGHARKMCFLLRGPFVREELPTRPMFLLVVKGSTQKRGKRRSQYRGPSYYLISAMEQGGAWQLPLPLETILAWLWQRWELEVAHREMKSNLGVGEKQCWNARSAVTSVQWGAWVYALMILAGYRTWGILGGPRPATGWWGGGKRWSFNSLWRAYRLALWDRGEFQPSWSGMGDNWLKMDSWLTSLDNAVVGAARI